jgi:hypothetical protein
MNVKRDSRHDLARAQHARYLGLSRVEKGRMVDEFCAVTGYNRAYGLRLLRHGPPAHRPSLQRAGRPLTYSPAVVRALLVAAEATGWICGKRMAAALPELVPALEREGALALTAEVRTALLGISAATIDRRLSAAKITAKPRGLATTKPGSLIKKQIAIKTYTPWDDQRPGFCEIDLVAHCGTSTAGSYLLTLDVTDVATGWTECVALANKGQTAVLAGLKQVRERLPFALLGIDSDNGSEFINDHLLRYCRREQLTFTRCRAYHKNDQAHVEQKNWSVVRQLVGYDRYEGAAALAQMERIFVLLHRYVNGYLPVMKLVGKEREGAKVRKRYDRPQTPYRRAREAGVVSTEDQAQFEKELQAQGPLGMRRRLDADLETLWLLRVGDAEAVAAATA